MVMTPSSKGAFSTFFLQQRDATHSAVGPPATRYLCIPRVMGEVGRIAGARGRYVFVSLTCGRSSQQARRTARPLPIVTQILSRDSAEQFVVEYPAQPGAFTYSPRGAALGPCRSMGPAATYTRPAGRFLVCDDGRDPGHRINLNTSSHFDARAARVAACLASESRIASSLNRI